MNTKNVREEIAHIIDLAVIDIISVIKAGLLNQVAEEAEKPAKKPKDEEQMRCRFSDGNGHRCKSRSKGPRFKYLCEKHLEK